MRNQCIYLLWIAVITAGAVPQPYENIIAQIQETSKEESTQNDVVCPTMFTAVGSQCLYFPFFIQESHVAAKQVCHSLQGELVVINDATQFQKLLKHIETFQSVSFWVDGEFDGTDWKFTNNDPMAMGTPFWYALADGTHSPGDGSINKCVSIHPESGFLMQDVDCNDVNKSPICEATPIALGAGEQGKGNEKSMEAENLSCPPFFIEVPGTGTCLAFITWMKQPWEMAKQTCAAIAAGAELYYFDDVEILRKIYDYLHGAGGLEGYSFWLGAQKYNATTRKNWIDVNGNDVIIVPPFWGNSLSPEVTDFLEPDKDGLCLALLAEGQHYFRDYACDPDEPLRLNPLCTVTP